MSKEIDNLKKLVKRLNSFDNFYEMSDSPKIFNNGLLEETKLRDELVKLPDEDLDFIMLNLNETGKIAYNRYFK